MASARLVSVTIIDDSMYHGKGIVIRWVQIVTRSFARSARHHAPRRTGRLKAGILPGTPRNPGRKIVSGSIASSAPYSLHVLKGTHGPIMSSALWAAGGPNSPAAYKVIPRRNLKGQVRMVRVPNKGMTMAVGRNPWPPEKPMFTVSGQSANNFLLKAWVETGAKHPAIRGIAFPLDL